MFDFKIHAKKKTWTLKEYTVKGQIFQKKAQKKAEMQTSVYKTDGNVFVTILIE